MAKQQKRISLRGLIQLSWTALTNGFAYGFLHRQIYTGSIKRFCVPGLNCYSCPGALGACPIGALQAVITDRHYSFSYYVVGTLIFLGALFGRLICGFLCPFGWIQELIYKIPFPGKRKSLPGHRYLRYLKYVIFLVFVIVLPLTLVTLRTGTPAFCKYICPSGTLMGGLPQVVGNEALSNQAGNLFIHKCGVLGVILLLCLGVYRPFCKYFCPLGAFYALFNRIAVVRLTLDQSHCIRCGACDRACPMSCTPSRQCNDAECVRCGACIRACPTQAIHYDTPFTHRSPKSAAPESAEKTE